MTYLWPFLASYFFIFLKSWQQLNVVRALYWWIVPTSLFMACVEVFVIAQVAVRGWDIHLVIAVGLGGGMGSACATWVHKRFVK